MCHNIACKAHTPQSIAFSCNEVICLKWIKNSVVWMKQIFIFNPILILLQASTLQVTLCSYMLLECLFNFALFIYIYMILFLFIYLFLFIKISLLQRTCKQTQLDYQSHSNKHSPGPTVYHLKGALLQLTHIMV